MINVTINGEIITAENRNIWDLIKFDKKLEPSQVVVEYNQKILKREYWKSTVLKEGDKLEIVSFVGGG